MKAAPGVGVPAISGEEPYSGMTLLRAGDGVTPTDEGVHKPRCGGGPHHTEGASGGVACDRRLYTKSHRSLRHRWARCGHEPFVIGIMNPLSWCFDVQIGR